MAVVSTVLFSAMCTTAALLSMVLFGVSGWTILQIYGGFCAALVLTGAAAFVVLQRPDADRSDAGDSFSDEHLRNFENRIAVSEP